jgi:3',5'-cyclic AMP phosphodiesterase CpdA
MLTAYPPSLQGFQADKPAEAHQPSPMPDRVILNWTADASTGFSVTWRTSTEIAKGMAEIVLADDGKDFPKQARKVEATTSAYTTNLGPAHTHSVTFTGLTPAADYLYRVGDGKNWSEWSQVRTASGKNQPLTFLYFGDAQVGILSHWSRVVRKAYSLAPEAKFMVYAGDLINRFNLDEEWGEWHWGAGWINKVVPIVPAPGNHEYGKLTPTSERAITVNWKNQFTLPLNGVAGEEETNYYTDIEGLRMVVLNSNLKHEEQAAWLDKLLTNNPKTWTVVTFHHPFHATAKNRDNKRVREAWQPVFDKHGVDLVLQGHDHTYGRTNMVTATDEKSGKAGTVYVVSVSGAKQYELDHKPVFQRAAEQTQMFQIIRINGDKLSYESRTAGGELYDAFDLIKQKGKANRLVNRIPSTPERKKK